MSQAKLTEFYNGRKRGSAYQPSKKQKVMSDCDVVAATASVTSAATTVTTKVRPSFEEALVSGSVLPQKASKRMPDTVVAEMPAKPKVAEVSKQVPNTTTVAAKGKTQSSQRKPAAARGKRAQKVAASGVQDIRSVIGSIGSKMAAKDTALVTDVVAVPTAVCDDHGNSHPSTPTKRQQKDGLVVSQCCKRGRRLVATPETVIGPTDVYSTPQKFDFTPFVSETAAESHSSRARKKLVLPRTPTTSPPVFSFKGQDSISETPKKVIADEKNTQQIDSNASILIEAPAKVSIDNGSKSVTASDSAVSVTHAAQSVLSSRKIVSDGNKSKTLEASATVTDQKSSVPAKPRIGTCKNLAELKQKLAEFNANKTKASEALERARLVVKCDEKITDKTSVSASGNSHSEPSTCEVAIKPTITPPDDVQTKAPAYIRHSSLAIPSTTLLLPYHYRLLNEQFQSSDTVVSWLTNRSEICTFDKLKAAVQDMTKRAFSEKQLGQIKTVYPMAYNFRQEKDLPMFGGKHSGFQLTIEANLDGVDTGDQTCGKAKFTATKLLERKNIFIHNLTQIVKRHHREFLSKLNVHITVSDDDIKRWHPRFVLDDVPDIETSSLPQGPVVKKFLTARDVLDEVKDKHMNPQIRKALECVASKNEKNEAAVGTFQGKQSSPQTKQHHNVDKPNNNNSPKGVTLSLLERVRAKEAKKLEAEMTRSNEDVKRLAMLQRLPELTRILRSHFLSQKRPALPVSDVVKSFVDSYKSALGSAEAESHLKLIGEVVPDFLKIVRVKSGEYVKIDQTADLTTVHDTIQNIIKAM